MLKNFPTFALLSGTTVLTLIAIACFYEADTLKRAWKLFKAWVYLFIFMVVVFGLRGMLLFWPTLWDMMAIVSLAIIICAGFITTRPIECDASIETDVDRSNPIIAIFFSFIVGFMWTCYSQQEWGYTAIFLRVLADNFGTTLATGFAASIIGFCGCFPIAHQLVRSRFKTDGKVRSLRPLHSATSHTPLEPIALKKLLPLLTDHERVAQELKNVNFEGWWCPEWGELSRDTIYLKAYVQNKGNGYSQCPVGEELTVTRPSSKVIKAATTTSTGIRQITLSCKCCDYHKEWEETIPRLPPPSSGSSGSSSSRRRSSSSSSGSYGGSYGGDYGGSSSSGGGGSFGGGSSGGGGAGGDF